MDTVMAKLPSEVGIFLRENIAVIEIVSMFSIGAYNALETVFITFDIVKNYRSLYFWSMQAASWGILVHALPAMACFLSHAPNLPMSIPFFIGWYAMVTGQSIVLYSRLHLVVLDISKVRWVLWMIIVNVCILHVPMTALFLGLNHGNTRFARPAMIYNWIQLAGFCVQDLVICGIYIYEAIRALKCIVRIRGRKGRKVIIHLLWVNVLVVFLNILLLLTEYKLHYIQVSFKTVVYSIKLKVEFSVLNRLRSLVHSPFLASPPDPMQQCRPSIDMNLFQADFPCPIVALDLTVPPRTGPEGVIRGDSPSSSIFDYHETLRQISDVRV
ncbi:hypothetical protein N7448_011255 [Penicillium atrosanguineum]|nr:hypothetical protein N7448_011255 [Penicillium atrosanguineum]